MQVPSNTWKWCMSFFWSDGGLSQSQDDSIVGTRHCRHSLAIMPIPGTLSSSSPDLLQPTTSMLDFSNPSGNVSMWHCGQICTQYTIHLSLVQQILDLPEDFTSVFLVHAKSQGILLLFIKAGYLPLNWKLMIKEPQWYFSEIDVMEWK